VVGSDEPLALLGHRGRGNLEKGKGIALKRMMGVKWVMRIGIILC
jgi:hypothetical protein